MLQEAEKDLVYCYFCSLHTVVLMVTQQHMWTRFSLIREMNKIMGLLL